MESLETSQNSPTTAYLWQWYLLTGDILLKGFIMLSYRKVDNLSPKDIFTEMFYCTLISGGDYSNSKIIGV